MADKSIYTGLFLVEPVIIDGKPSFGLSKYHVTYHFNPGDPIFPENVAENDWGKIIHKGIYDDGEIVTSHVHIQEQIDLTDKEPDLKRDYNHHIRNQFDSNTPLHITWLHGEARPIEAGDSLRKALNHEDGYQNNYISLDRLIYSNNWEGILKNNKLDVDADGMEAYRMRIDVIFKYMNTMGLWYTMKSSDK